MRAEFLVLGPLEVVVDGRAVPVPAGRGRVLLATLLLRANRFVSVDELIERLWEGAPPSPDRAKTTLQMVVTRLRQALGETNCVRTMTGGYVADVGVDQLDLSRFRALVDVGRLGEALGLWRGPVLANVASESLHRDDVPALLDEQLVVLERRIEADLERGVASELVPELRLLTQQHPLRERFWGQLMLALYRSDQQADALDAYRGVSGLLAEELGVNPGATLTNLHQRILVGDPELAVLVGSPGGPVPRQLPARVGHFVGRAEELLQLSRLVSAAADECGTVVISAINGAAGIGKTALAVHWAHGAADQFADGQLYVNLRGFDPSGVPTSPSDAIRGFLNAFEVAPDRIPMRLDDQAALYRSLVADRKLLVVLDNARDTEQVMPLLPGSPACRVVITSRSQLTGLTVQADIRPITLGLLNKTEALALLRRRLGADRISAEPAAVETIIAHCAGLPLALAVVAARAAVMPKLMLCTLVEELANEGTRLDALDTDDQLTSVRPVFSWSYDRLDPLSARMFRLLGLHPGPDISLVAAACLAGTSVAVASEVLADLACLHLVTQHQPDRFALHDLLRAYAAHEAKFHDGEQQRQEALLRVLDHYLHTTLAAAGLIHPERRLIAVDPPSSGGGPRDLTDDQQAWAWLDAEYQVLRAAFACAADGGFNAHTWQLPWLLTTYFERRGRWQDWSQALQTAVVGAQRLGDRKALASVNHYLGHVLTRTGVYEGARVAFEKAIDLRQELADPVGEADVHRGLSWMYEMQGQYRHALEHGMRSMDLAKAAGNQLTLASALNAVGLYHVQLGEHRKALSYCQQSVDLQHELGHRYGEANSLDTLGYAYHHLGEHGQAVRCYLDSLGLFEKVGGRSLEGEVRDHLGDTQFALGDLAAARHSWQQALVILDDLQHPTAEKVRAKLGRLM